MGRLGYIVSLCVAGSLAVAPPASADATASASEKLSPADEAKRLFDEASKEIDAGRPTVGRDLLRRSLALYPALPTRYNLGVALRLSGETTEAVAMFEGLLGESEVSKPERARIEDQLRGARSELATLTVGITGSPTATIEVDAREVGTAEADAPVTVQLDAGTHVVIARAGGVTRQQVDLDQGQSTTIDLHVLSLTEQQRADRRKRRKRRAAWITGTTVAVVGIVLAAVLATRPDNTKPPLPGEVDPIETPAAFRLGR